MVKPQVWPCHGHTGNATCSQFSTSIPTLSDSLQLQAQATSVYQPADLSPTTELSPQALEQRYADVLAHFSGIVAVDQQHDRTACVADVSQDESCAADVNSMDCVLSQLPSPVSKFLDNVKPFTSPPANSPKPDIQWLMNQPQCMPQQLPQDDNRAELTASATPQHSSERTRPPPPRFPQDSAYSSMDGGSSYVQDSVQSLSQQPHIPSKVLQQLASQQLRITELEKELDMQREQVAATQGMREGLLSAVSEHTCAHAACP
jgi:hypothetical protein